MTKTELIQETVDFYSADTSRRSMEEEGCAYLAENGTKCAVGRCMTQEALKDYGNVPITADAIKDLDSLLLQEYQGHPVKLWQELQRFHDAGSNWDAQGITKEGKQRVQELLIKYAN